MSCAKCGADIGYTPAEGVTVTCGSCVQGLCAGELRRQEDKLAHYSGLDCIAKRKQLQWTQSMLGSRVGISVQKVSAFERGLDLCPAEVAAWMDG